MADSGSVPQRLMWNVEPVVSDRLGGLFETRVGLRNRIVAVVGDAQGKVSIVLPSGELRVGPADKLSDVQQAASFTTRSAPGRLHALLQSGYAGEILTPEAQAKIRQQMDGMLQDADHALGFLLDRSALALDPQRCFDLPLEPWRVRYELLTDDTLDHVVAASYANEILGDPAAPDGVRLVVGIKYQLSLAEVDPTCDELFSDSSEQDAQGAAEVLDAATTAAQMLERIGVANVTALGEARHDPVRHAADFPRCAVLAVLDGQLAKTTPLEPDPRIPISVIDDLIDSGATFTHPSFGDAPNLPASPDIPLRAYLTARVQPSDLTNHEVELLGFTTEAYRRVVAGDALLAMMLDADGVANAEAAQALSRGDTPAVAPADGRLQALTAAKQTGTLEGVDNQLLGDVSTWRTLVQLSPPSTKPDTENSQRLSDLSHLHGARRATFDWDWEAARSIARDGLRWSTTEAVRDELLNIVACTLWLQDEHEPALAALEKALEGEYTDALLANAAVVASELDHAAAVRHFTKLAREAPSSEMKAIAAERALLLWANDDAGIWDGDDDELPVEIRDALRPLIRQQLPEERYVRLLKALAIHDDEWLAGKRESDFGPNANSHAQRVFQARATGLDEFARGLAHEFNRGAPPAWVVEERDSIVASAIGVLVDDISHLGAAMFGMALLEADIKIPDDDHVALVCLTVTSIADNIDPENGEPKDEFIDWLEDARRKYDRLDADDAARLERLVEIASEALARSCAAARYHQLDQAIDGYNNVMGAIRGVPSRRLNTAAVASALRPLHGFCTETDALLRRVRLLVTDPELIGLIDAVMTDNIRLGSEVRGFM